MELYLCLLVACIGSIRLAEKLVWGKGNKKGHNGLGFSKKILCALPPSAFVNRPPWNGLEYDLANNEEDEKKPLMTYKANNVKKYPFFSFPFWWGFWIVISIFPSMFGRCKLNMCLYFKRQCIFNLTICSWLHLPWLFLLLEQW